MNQSYIAGAVDQSGTAYIGNFEYNTLKGNSTLTTLSRIYNDEGYVENLANPQYYYYRRDHLGDNREVWLANTNTVSQRTQYYPSGLPWAYQTGDNPDLQHRKYNGKEFVEMHGYDTYDIVWRQYYPAIMRFQTPDPEVEQFYNLSPYSMCDNNMENKTDPDGRFAQMLIGGTVNALMDYGIQVASNYVEGNQNPWTNVNKTQIAVSFVAGAVGVGLATKANEAVKLMKLGQTATRVAEHVAQAGVDAVVSSGAQLAKNGKVSGKNVVVDVAGGQLGKAIGDKLKSVKQESKEAKLLYKQANHDQRVAGDTPRPSRAARAQNSQNKATNYGTTQATKTGTSVANAPSSVNTLYESNKKKHP